jgi:hypothetical protein
VRLTNRADVIVDAPNVTLRRIEVQGGVIDNWVGDCDNGLVIEDSTIGLQAGTTEDWRDHWAIGTGGYTLRRVEMQNRSDGLRVGGKSGGCGPVVVQDSFLGVSCERTEWHTDGIQGYDGDRLTIRNVTIDYQGGCGTSPFFYPNQGNTYADVNGLLMVGNAGYMFRLGVPGRVSNTFIENGSWGYGPIDVKCSVVDRVGGAIQWDVRIVEVSSNWQPTATVRAQPCNTEGGN